MTDTSDREIGRRIAALRKQRGWSQSYLASLVGTDQSVLSRIEAAKRRIGARELDRLAKALGVEPATLLPDEDKSVVSAALSVAVSEETHLPRADHELSGPPPRLEQRRTSIAAFTPDERSRPSPAFFGRPSRLERKAAGADVSVGVEDELGERLEELSFALAYHDFSDSAPMSRPLEASAFPAAPSRPEAPSLPPSVATVIADYLRLRPSPELDVSPSSASWDSVDAHGRRRSAGKPSGSVAGRIAASVSWNEPRDRYARLWRHELGIGVDTPVPDLVALFEDAGVAEVIVARLEAHEPVCANVTAPGALGEPSEEVSFLFVNADRPVTLQRHALVHAFAHLALGHGDVVDRRIEWSRATPLEMEANDFAEEFLAPAEAVARWYARHGDPRPSVDVLLDLAAAFGVTYWAAYYRSRAAGRLGEKPQAQLMRELRARQWELLPEQSYRGGLRDTLSTLSEESPLPPPGAVGVGGVPAPLTCEPGAPAVLRVPGRLRVWTLQALRSGRLSLEQAAAVLRRSPGELAAELERLGVD